MMRAQRLELYELPDYKPQASTRPTITASIPAEQETETYLGMGLDINVHDQWAVESPGPVFDRTNEHLGKSDVGIIAYRRMLRRAIEAAGKDGDLPMVLRNGDGAAIRGPAALDTIAGLDDWQEAWKARDKERREASGWAPDPW